MPRILVDDGRLYRRCRVCNTKTGPYLHRGQYYTSNFCKQHYCQIVENGRMCTQPRGPLQGPYCSRHLRCTAFDGAQLCNESIKDLNPTKHKFCSQKHCCSDPTCSSARAPGKPYCLAHLCTSPSACTAARRPDERYCARHRCAHDHCGSLVSDPPAANPDQPVPAPDHPSSFCDAHRPCARAGCPRRCHMFDSGQLAPWCGDHYCRWDTTSAAATGLLGPITGTVCTAERVARPNAAHCDAHTCHAGSCARPVRNSPGALFCAVHACTAPTCCEAEVVGAGTGSSTLCARHECREPGCVKAAVVEGGYCAADHECSGQGCAARRFRAATWCPGHKCAMRECDREARAEDGYCERHRKCVMEGCGEFRLVEGEEVRERCAKHHLHPCTYPTEGTCSNLVALADGPHCATHSRCALPGCSQPRRPPPDSYCANHKCQVAKCHALRLGFAGLSASAVADIAAAAVDDISSALLASLHHPNHPARHHASRDLVFSPFCQAHTCRHKGCFGLALGDCHPWCPDHACTIKGCSNEATQQLPGTSKGSDRRRGETSLREGTRRRTTANATGRGQTRGGGSDRRRGCGCRGERCCYCTPGVGLQGPALPPPPPPAMAGTGPYASFGPLGPQPFGAACTTKYPFGTGPYVHHF